MAKKRRTIPGMVTLVGTRLRIVNGNVESLRRLRKPGRPKKSENIVKTKRVPKFPGASDLRELSVRNGFHLIRHRSRRDYITKQNLSLQAKFDALCSEVKLIDPYSWEHAEIEERLNTSKTSRIEKSVPYSFCCCKEQTEEDEMPCLIHGLKIPNCDCGGINGITGYRMCTGHRATGHIVGVVPFVTERMRESKESADQQSREMGWM